MENRNMKQQHEDWIRTHWRPMMAFVYMAIVLFDFIIGPIFWSIIQIYGGSVTIQWSPLTLIAGGVFHAAMGAVLGISAFTRGKEKVESIRAQYNDDKNDEGKHWNNDSLM
jgi:hypothetical protein